MSLSLASIESTPTHASPPMHAPSALQATKQKQALLRFDEHFRPSASTRLRSRLTMPAPVHATAVRPGSLWSLRVDGLAQSWWISTNQITIRLKWSHTERSAADARKPTVHAHVDATYVAQTSLRERRKDVAEEGTVRLFCGDGGRQRGYVAGGETGRLNAPS